MLLNCNHERHGKLRKFFELNLGCCMNIRKHFMLSIDNNAVWHSLSPSVKKHCIYLVIFLVYYIHFLFIDIILLVFLVVYISL